MDENVVKEWEHAGFKCVIIKHSTMGHYCGYVYLPEDHPLAGRGDEDINMLASVHGGVTYGAWEEEGEEKFYVVGFDCAHAGDYMPGLRNGIPRFGTPGDHKWTLEEVTEEVNHFAEQLTIPSLVEQKLSQ